MVQHAIELDTAVRDWVFIPLSLCILLMKLLTQYAHMLMNVPVTASTKDLKEVREQQLVMRSQRLRTAGYVLPESGFKMRKEFLVNKATGVFNQKVVSKSLQENMATDPSMMVNMLKKNLTGIVPQLAMGMVVNFFFSGFVLGKVPFALSPRFKLMLQRGIDLTSLDVSYFTSLSFYILLLFGLQGVFQLVFKGDTVDETENMRRQMNPGANAVGPFDADAAFKGERTALAMLDHEWEVERSEEKAVEMLKHMASVR